MVYFVTNLPKKNQAGKLAAISHMCGYFSPQKSNGWIPQKSMGWDLGKLLCFQHGC